jgi:hypothetical protein
MLCVCGLRLVVSQQRVDLFTWTHTHHAHPCRPAACSHATCSSAKPAVWCDTPLLVLPQHSPILLVLPQHSPILRDNSAPFGCGAGCGCSTSSAPSSSFAALHAHVDINSEQYVCMTPSFHHCDWLGISPSRCVTDEVLYKVVGIRLYSGRGMALQASFGLVAVHGEHLRSGELAQKFELFVFNPITLCSWRWHSAAPSTPHHLCVPLSHAAPRTRQP